MQPRDIREKIGRFRILVVGRANAGKTTLLQRVCNTTENPEVFDGAGNKVDAAIVESSVYRGQHDIKNEVVFRSNPNFVFHDSCGFEAGGEDEFKKMKEFVVKRASTLKLKGRIHAIWYCIPMDECHRAITKAEERFFSECDTSSVPVIAVFTKFDALWDDAYEQLKDSGLSRSESKRKAPEIAKAIFAKAKIWDRLCENPYPPKDHVYLAEMEKDNADCGALLECTTGALGEEAMQILLISTQQTNLALCIKYAVEKALILYIKKARNSTSISSRWLSKETCSGMQKAISVWFPHMQSVNWWDDFWRERDTTRRAAWDDEEEARRRRTAWADWEFWEAFGKRAGEWENFDPDNLLTGNAIGNSLEVQSASLTSFLPFHSLTQTLQLGIALIIILEHSFFVLQEGKQEPENILEVATAKYKTSHQTAIEEAVKKVLRQDDGDDEKLGNMVETIILCNRMSKV